MKYVICQNNNPNGKYFKGIRCYEELLVDDNAQAGLCWKCTAMMVPPPDEKKPTGYPRGWKFMAEFVDKEGNVYHKGQIQQDLFGTLPPSEIKETRKKPSVKKKNSLEDKIADEYKRRAIKKKSKKK